MTRASPPRWTSLLALGWLAVMVAGCAGAADGAAASATAGSAATGAGTQETQAAAGAAGHAGIAGAAGAAAASGGSNAGTTAGTSPTAGDSAAGGDAGAFGGAGGIGGTGGMAAAGDAGDGVGEAGSAGATSGNGGAGDGASGAPSAYPCDGDPSSYDVVVRNASGSWVVERDGNQIHSGSDMRAAIQAGIDSLDQGRTSKQSVLVLGSGSIAASARISVASFTLLNVCGTIDVTGSGSGDMAPIYARGQTDIEIPNLKLTGTPLYGMFFRDVENLHLGQIDLRLASGLGIRIDNHGRANRGDKVKNIRIDHVYVEGTSTQGVETYGVDDLTIGTVIARSVGDCGLLLNDTTNAEIGLVDAIDAGSGTGYAAFRMANRNGRIGSEYPVNIHVGEVIARGGGRGIFCVSESGGAVIDRIDIADTGSNAILIENCHNVSIATEAGSVTGGGDIRIAARTEFANTSDITIQNLTVTDSAVNEMPCADGDTRFVDNTLVRSPSNVCD